MKPMNLRDKAGGKLRGDAMKASPGLALLACLAVAAMGCGSSEADPITADEVITLEVCGSVVPDEGEPDAGQPGEDEAIQGPCALVADGVSEVTVRVCVPVEDRRRDLSAALSLSAGRWRLAEAGTDGLHVDVPLGEAGCDERSFVTPTAVEPAVLVRAELLGFTASRWIQLVPVAVAELVLSAEPAAFEPNAQVKITAGLHAEGSGQISDGTEVVFEIAAVDPADASAWLHPTRSEVAAGQAVSILTVGASAQSVTVRATAQPPVVEGVEGPGPVSRELVLQLRQP